MILQKTSCSNLFKHVQALNCFPPYNRLNLINKTNLINGNTYQNRSHFLRHNDSLPGRATNPIRRLKTGNIPSMAGNNARPGSPGVSFKHIIDTLRASDYFSKKGARGVAGFRRCIFNINIVNILFHLWK